MQVSLRSQMAAGMAVVGAAAIAVAPVVQPEVLATPQRVMANIEQVVFNNPLTAAWNTLNLINTYLLAPGYDNTGNPGALANWGSNALVGTPGTTQNNVGGALPGGGVPVPGSPNAEWALLGTTDVGLLANLLNNPFPILTQVGSNLLGYANVLTTFWGQALVNLSSVAWLVPSTALTVIQDIASLNFAKVITDITTAVSTGITLASNAATDVFAGLTAVAQTIAARATALGTAIAATAGQLPAILGAEFAILARAATGAFTNITTAVTTPGATIDDVWNAVLANLVGPNLPGGDVSLLGVLVNQVLGIGTQITPGETWAGGTFPAGGFPTFAPSLRFIGSGLQLQVVTALSTAPVAPVPPAPVASVRAGAGSARAAAADSATAASSDSTPAPRTAAKRAGARSGGDSAKPAGARR